MNADEPLAIIGIGCLFPGSAGLAGYWARITAGADSITDVPPTHWRPEDYHHPDPKAPDRVYTARGGFLDPVPFNPAAFGIAPNALEATDTAQLLGLVVARQALEDAGYSPGGLVGDGQRAFDRSRVSVILGVTGTLELVIPLGARLGHPVWRRALKEAGVEDAVAEEVVRRIADSYVGWQENSFPGLLGNVVAGRIANRLDLGGTNCVVDAACASSLGALHLAALELHSGRSDMVLTGGVDTFNDVFMYMCFSKTPALSPTGDARPFDAAADGTILGEGVGMVVLKRLADARRDGDRVYAVVRGLGSSSDGKGNSIYAPRAGGQGEALRKAYAAAAVTPDTVELVEAHGTGTRVGDATEVAALTEVYGQAGRPGTWCALGSVKSQIGHTKAAAGVAGLIKAAAALYHKVLPPTIKVERPLDALAPGRTPFYVNAENRPWMPSPDHPRRAAVSAFGFGGSNFHCVLEEADPRKPGIDWDGDVQVLAFAAQRPTDLDGQLASWPAGLAWEDFRARAAATREAWQPGEMCRLLLVVQRDRTDPARQFAAARELLAKHSEQSFVRGPDGIFYGRGAVAGGLAVLFPGQGAQYPGMLRDLACRFPAMHDTLAEADHAFGARLSDRIYPPAAFTPEARAANESALRATEVAQVALGAVALGAWRVLEHFGVRADAAAGHSYGELVALCAAGRLSPAELHRLSLLRGRLMADVGQAGSLPHDAGAMLAVHAPEETIRDVLRTEGLDLVLANKNAPRQTVLSGPTPRVEQAARAFAARQVRAQHLAVAAAFHSPLVAAAEAPFRGALDSVDMRPGDVPVFANTTAGPYPDDPAGARDLLAGQLARPVEFVAEVNSLYQSGVRTFLEVGPGSRLTGLVTAILEGRDHVALALDGSAGQRSGMFDLACCLAALSARGHDLRLSAWDPVAPPAPEPAKPALLVPICGANYVQPKPPREYRPASNGTATVNQNGTISPTEAARPGGEGNASAPPSAPGPAAPLPPPADASALTQALQVTRESMAALQKMQEQAAGLHRQFLEGQEAAQRTVHLLVEQQQRLLQVSLGLPASAAAGWAESSRPTDSGVIPRSHAERGNASPNAPRPVFSPGPDATRIVADAPSHAERGNEEVGGTLSVPVGRVLEAHPTAPPAVPAPPPAAQARVESILLEVVGEKTGYPSEMLDLDMALDADLGIDSIKRVEILSALQERLPDAPAVKPDHLGSLHTLRHIAAFLTEGAPASGTTEAVDAPRSPAASNEDAVRAVLLEVVGEKTGYPSEMLDLDMALDADLGIDSIKRVEILSALQERLPDAPAVKPDHLGSLHTLRHIAAFLADGQPAQSAEPFREGATNGEGEALAEPSTPAARQEPRPPAEPIAASPLERSVLQAVPLANVPARLPIHLPPDAEIWLSADDAALSQGLAQHLQRLGFRPRLAPCRALRDLERPAALGGLVLLAPAQPASDAFPRDALLAARHAAPALRAGRGILLTVSRLDGAFGLADPDAGREPVDGGLAGLAKTARHEWPDVHCKALDLAADADAAAVVEEMFLSGPVEVGIDRTGRRTLQLVAEPLPAGGEAPFQPGDVVVLSGGARGVTAEVAVALARAFRPTLVLLGRSPAPQAEPDWLAPLTSEADIKRELGIRANGNATPKLIGEQYQLLTAGREVRRTLGRIEATGARAVYRPVDVRDPAAVASVLAQLRSELGPVRGLVHGAGVLADARIEDKTAEQFDRVYATKVGGLRSLLAAVPPEELRVLVLFSSSTARFGRTGQVDYAMANEVLNKLAQQHARRLPACRVVSVNWGPWDGGMVTASLKKVFAQEGIGLIPLQAGADSLVRELRAPAGQAVEVVVGLRIADCGLRIEEPKAAEEERSEPPPQSATGLRPAFERVLTVAEHPVLEAHVLDGRPVLPLALTLEWLAQAALHHNPGLAFHGCNELRVLHGVVLDGPAPTLRVTSTRAARRDSLYLAAAELRGTRPGGREVVHARAEIVLAATLPVSPPPLDRAALSPYPHTAAEVYQVGLLFHGPELQGIERVEGCGERGIAARFRAAPPPAEWVRQPLRQKWVTDPLALDCCFQLMILWARQRHGAPGLPCLVGRYRQYRRAFPADGVRADLHVTRATGLHAVADADLLDAEGQVVARLEGLECAIDPGLERAFRNNQLTAV